MKEKRDAALPLPFREREWFDHRNRVIECLGDDEALQAALKMRGARPHHYAIEAWERPQRFLKLGLSSTRSDLDGTVFMDEAQIKRSFGKAARCRPRRR
jgi:hypothetical protein